MSESNFLSKVWNLLGGLLLSIVILIGCIGGVHSFIYNIDYHKKADKALQEQPLILHYFPKCFRYGIYDVQNFFAGEKNTTEQTNQSEE